MLKAHSGKALAMMALAVALAGPAAAQQRPPVVQDQASEIIQLQNRIQRQQFEQQQQIYKQLDRQQNAQPQPPPRVPAFQQNCQIQLSGNSYIRTCR
ncbi:hypothetical protein ACVCNR_05995 [Aquamicrobium terrae]